MEEKNNKEELDKVNGDIEDKEFSVDNPATNEDIHRVCKNLGAIKIALLVNDKQSLKAFEARFAREDARHVLAGYLKDRGYEYDEAKGIWKIHQHH